MIALGIIVAWLIRLKIDQVNEDRANKLLREMKPRKVNKTKLEIVKIQ